eukprot:1160533-Pelagomonas_calceolata.AAC.5
MRDQCKRPIQRLLLTTRLPGTVAAHACGRAGTTWPKRGSDRTRVEQWAVTAEGTRYDQSGAVGCDGEEEQRGSERIRGQSGAVGCNSREDQVGSVWVRVEQWTMTTERTRVEQWAVTAERTR